MSRDDTPCLSSRALILFLQNKDFSINRYARAMELSSWLTRLWCRRRWTPTIIPTSGMFIAVCRVVVVAATTTIPSSILISFSSATTPPSTTGNGRQSRRVRVENRIWHRHHHHDQWSLRIKNRVCAASEEGSELTRSWHHRPTPKPQIIPRHSIWRELRENLVSLLI